MGIVQGLSACPDLQIGFETFSPTFQVNSHTKTQLSARSFDYNLELRHIYHQVLSFSVYSQDMFYLY